MRSGVRHIRFRQQSETLESTRRHANNRERHALHVYRTTNCRDIAAEAALPEPITSTATGSPVKAQVISPPSNRRPASGVTPSSE